MALDIANVHKMQRKPGGTQMVITGINEYKRFMQQGETPISVQGGRFYGDEGPVIKRSDVPGWVRKVVGNMTVAALRAAGLPPEGVTDWEDDSQVEPEPPENKDQNLTLKEEPLSIVDAVYSLDASNDDHWTKHGLPSLAALSSLMDATTPARAEVEEVTSGYRRPTQET